ncbi:hypothetical protein Tco_0158368 [Tanacetum coccineum]
MGDKNPMRTLGDYSKPSHEGYRNTIELPEGNNVVPLRSDTIRLVQNRCSFHGLRSEDPNQHLKDFLKLVDSLDLDVANRERTRMRLTLKSPSSRHRSLAPSPNLYDHVNPATRQTIDQSVGGKLRDNESWNDPRDFAKPVKAISLPQDVPMVPKTLSTAWKTASKLLLIMRPRVPTKREAQTFTSPQTGSLSTYTSSYQTKLEKALGDFESRQEKRLSSLGTQLGQQIDDMIGKINNQWKAVSEKLNDTPTPDTAGNFIKESEAKEKGSVEPNEAECNNHKRTVEAKEEVEEESEKELEEETGEETEEEEEDDPKYFDIFPIMEELRYHEWLLKNPRPSGVKAKIRTENLNNMKFSCRKAYLLEDKKIPSVGVFEAAFGWLLEEIHVTWAQLEKKQTRLRLYTNYLEEKHTVRGDGVANYKRRRQSYQGTASWNSRRRQNEADLKKP